MCLFTQKEVHLLTFQFPLRYIGIALVVLDIPGLFSQNSGGIIAHFGGYLLDTIMQFNLKKELILGEFINQIILAFFLF